MKLLKVCRIFLLLAGIFISTQLMSNEHEFVKNDSHGDNYSYLPILARKNGAIILESRDTTLVFRGNIGDYPKYDGIKSILDTIENSVNNLLQGKTPYMCFLKRNGQVQESHSIVNDTITYKIILTECQEEDRYWKFAIAGTFYLADTLILSYNNYIPVHADNIWLLKDKSYRWESVGVSSLSPSDISSIDNRKYLIKRNQKIDLKNSTDNTESSQHSAFSSGHLFFSCASMFGKVSNKALINSKLVDVKHPNLRYSYSLVYQDQTIESNYSRANRIETKADLKQSKGYSSSNQFNKNASSTITIDKLNALELAVKKSKKSPQEKKKLLGEVYNLKKQLLQIEKAESGVSEFINHITIGDKQFYTPKNCLHCKGTGIMNECGGCYGRGVRYCSVCSGKKYTPDGRVCLNCRGNGLLTCIVCKGKRINIKCNHSIELGVY